MEHSRSQRPELAPTLHFEAWDDPTIDELGHDVLDHDTPAGQPPYCETFWLPVIGPTTLLLLRRANQHLQVERDASVPTELLPKSLGLGSGIGRSSRLADTIARAERFGLARLDRQGEHLEVRTHLPPLNNGLQKQLPEPLRALHQHLYTARQANPSSTTPTAPPGRLKNVIAADLRREQLTR